MRKIIRKTKINVVLELFGIDINDEQSLIMTPKTYCIELNGISIHYY